MNPDFIKQCEKAEKIQALRTKDNWENGV